MDSDFIMPEHNMLYYVQHAKDSFDTSGFNEIDGLVLSQIANMELGDAGIDLNNGNSKTFSQIYNEAKAHNMNESNNELLVALAESPRFQNLSVSDFVKNPANSGVKGFTKVEGQNEIEQFAAVTITYQQNGKTVHHVSYRATDASTNGWVEDLAMLYSSNTQAQSDSVAYMNMVGRKTYGHITGGGHSKGGGDFEYAYLFCDDAVRERITKGYVYDSPGLTDEVLSRTSYYESYKRITEGSFVCPQDSIIGQVLHEGDNATFVHSTENGFKEHHPYTWEIDPSTNTFVRDNQTELSKYINKSLDRAVSNMSQREREAFFTYVSFLLFEGGDEIAGTGELFTKNWTNEDDSFNWDKLCYICGIVYQDWHKMSPEQKRSFIKSLASVTDGFAVTAYDYAKQKAKDWVSEKLGLYDKRDKDARKVISDWPEEKKKEFEEFLDRTYQALVVQLKELVSWIFNGIFGNGSYSAGTLLKVDTYKLSSYALSLKTINGKLANIDNRMNSLYGHVGLKGLWDLIQADLLTGFSWRLMKCASYLEETAQDFRTLENSIVIELDG